MTVARTWPRLLLLPVQVLVIREVQLWSVVVVDGRKTGSGVSEWERAVKFPKNCTRVRSVRRSGSKPSVTDSPWRDKRTWKKGVESGDGRESDGRRRCDRRGREGSGHTDARRHSLGRLEAQEGSRALGVCLDYRSASQSV